jgi:hypothetical protein
MRVVADYQVGQTVTLDDGRQATVIGVPYMQKGDAFGLYVTHSDKWFWTTFEQGATDEA